MTLSYISTATLGGYGDDNDADERHNRNDDQNFELAISPVHNFLQLPRTFLKLIGMILQGL